MRRRARRHRPHDRRRCRGLRNSHFQLRRHSHEGLRRKDRRHHRRRDRHGPRARQATGRRRLHRRHVRRLGREHGGDQTPLPDERAARHARRHARRRRFGRGSRSCNSATPSRANSTPITSTFCSTTPASAAARASSPARARNGRSTFNVCWYGVYYSTRAFMPMILKAHEAHIVNTSSVNGFWASLGPTRAHTAYPAAKFAVKGFTEGLINDLRLNAPHVKCSVVMPGHIGTSIIENTRKVLTGHTIGEMSRQGSRRRAPLDEGDGHARGHPHRRTNPTNDEGNGAPVRNERAHLRRRSRDHHPQRRAPGKDGASSSAPTPSAWTRSCARRPNKPTNKSSSTACARRGIGARSKW